MSRTAGVFNPTEGSVAASAWAMLLGFLVPQLELQSLRKVCLDTVETTATVMFIMAAAPIFGWMLTATGVTVGLAEWVDGRARSPGARRSDASWNSSDPIRWATPNAKLPSNLRALSLHQSFASQRDRCGPARYADSRAQRAKGAIWQNP